MSLPSIQGRGFLISEGVELKFSAAGNAYARLPISFKNSRKDPNTGNWTHDKEVLVEGTVFGALAESLAEVVTGRCDMWITGDLYTEEYNGKTQVKMNVHSAWPVKADRIPANAGASARASDLPF